MPKLTLYAPHPTNRRVIEMIAETDQVLTAFKELGIPGHEAAYSLEAFRRELRSLLRPSGDDFFVWADESWCYREEYSEADYGWKSDDFRVIHFNTPEYDAFDALHVRLLDRTVPPA